MHPQLHPESAYLLFNSQDLDQIFLTFGDIPHHGPVLLAWVLLRHTLNPDDSTPVIRRIGNTSLQLAVFQYLTTMLQALGSTGNNVSWPARRALWPRASSTNIQYIALLGLLFPFVVLKLAFLPFVSEMMLR